MRDALRATRERKGFPCDSKWHTLAVAGSLGLFASWNAVADDTSSTTWSDPSATRPAARSSPPQRRGRRRRRKPPNRRRAGAPGTDRVGRQSVRHGPPPGTTSGRHHRRHRHRQHAPGTIDRRDRSQTATRRRRRPHGRPASRGGPAVPSAATRPRRFNFSTAASWPSTRSGSTKPKATRGRPPSFYVNWDRFDYRPENLLEDIRRERPAFAETAPDSTGDAPSTPPPPDASPVTEWSGQPRATSTPASYQTKRPPRPASRSLPWRPLRQCECRRSLVGRNAPVAGDGRFAGGQRRHGPPSTRAGDDVHSPLRRKAAPVASFGDPSRPTLPPNGVLVQGSSPPAAPVYFPVRRDQPSINAPFPAQNDVALKPMHDPYLGDDSTTTDKLSAGVQAMRESTPPPPPSITST